ncbi:lactonase family protein [Agaribacterium sp. ZY112]|uniref:lactonase family protein n=1 Tax=Agaribacterium sp. ZY112 TaxID=3233574 RepID=UPI003523305C
MLKLLKEFVEVKQSLFRGVLIGVLFPLLVSSCATSDSVSESLDSGNKTYAFLLGNFDDKGVRRLTLDLESNELRDDGLVANVRSPGYMSLSANQNHLYLVSVDEHKRSSLAHFSWSNNKAGFDLVDKKDIKGISACHIALSSDQKQLAVSNYRSGDLELFSMSSSGSEINESAYFNNSKNLGGVSRPSHIHYANWSQDSSSLLVADLATDELLVFDAAKLSDKALTRKTDKLKPRQRLSLPKGSGPRHLAFHPVLDYVYVLNELSNSITLVVPDENAVYSLADSYRLLVDQVSSSADKKRDLSSAIRISSDGRFLYAAVRGEDSLKVFNIANDGRLKFVQSISTFGEHPRDFNFSSDQNYLLVANTFSDSISVFYRDQGTGKLNYLFSQSGLIKPSNILAFDKYK